MEFNGRLPGMRLRHSVALAPQARGVLGSTPGNCRLSHFPLFSPQFIYQLKNDWPLCRNKVRGETVREGGKKESGVQLHTVQAK